MPSAPALAISNTLVTVETSPTTRVLCVEWTIDSAPARTGEWIVEWDSMYASLTADLHSARSEKGSYFALQQSASTPDTTLSPQQRAAAAWLERQSHAEDLPTAPLSTAKLLQFENGLGGREVAESDDDLPKFFTTRPVVQAPAHITPAQQQQGLKGRAYFLLRSSADLPDLVRVLFIPTWAPPVVLAEVPVPRDHLSGNALHTAWAEARLADLKTLEDIARELEREGARGIGTGRVKVGVEGGIMDEEAVRREGWMVGEEMVWVTETFLTTDKNIPPTPIHPPHAPPPPPTAATTDAQPQKGGLKLTTTTQSLIPQYIPDEASPATSEDGAAVDDLFALPLSPRSPDMAMSPFSMFRGEPLGGSSRDNHSKLNQVLNFDDEKEITPTGISGVGLGLGLGLEGLGQLTPPAERKRA